MSSGLSWLITAESSASAPDCLVNTQFADWDDAENQAKLYCWIQGQVFGTAAAYAVISNSTRQQYVLYVSSVSAPYWTKVQEGSYPL
jgi:hypothetical protein